MSTANTINTRISSAYKCTQLDVRNESHQHNVPPGSETHFKLLIISDDFEGLTRVKRHQAIYALLSDLLASGIHALSLYVYTTREWATQSQGVADSPQCHGGSKN